MIGRTIAVAGSAACLLCAVSFYIVDEKVFAFRFLLGIIPCALMYLTISELQVNDQEIVYRSPVKTERLKWDEVEKIEADPRGNDILLYAKTRNKPLRIPGGRWWRGNDRASLVRTFRTAVDTRKIPTEIKEGIVFITAK